jgi:hypothetical protein
MEPNLYQQYENHLNTSLTENLKKCNDCKLASRRVSDGCEKVISKIILLQIFMCIYLKANPIIAEAYVTELNSNFLILIVPKFNLETVSLIIKFYFRKNLLRASCPLNSFSKMAACWLLIETPRTQRENEYLLLTHYKS